MWASAFTPLLLAAAALQAPRHRPLYPLYAMITGTANYTDADTEQIASNFEFSQGTGTAGFRAALRKIYPPTRTVMYSNPSGTGTAMNGPGGGLANMQAFERSHRCDTGNGWYVAGRLARAISQDTTQIHVVADAKKIGVVPAVPRGVLLSASTQGSGLYSRFSRGNPGRLEWVVYARLGDELMKVLSIRSTSGGNLTTLTVSRGFDRSQAAAHAVGEVVLAPLYESVPACQACPHQDLSYGLMASTTLAPDYLINFTCNALAAGYDGSWYDNFGSKRDFPPRCTRPRAWLWACRTFMTLRRSGTGTRPRICRRSADVWTRLSPASSLSTRTNDWRGGGRLSSPMASGLGLARTPSALASS